MPDCFDIAITGAGPAGAACALAAAQAGWRVALVERAVFPRHKVCGDCLNPSVWPVLASLGVAPAVQALTHAALHRVRFAGRSGRRLEVPLPAGAERAVTRESFDACLLDAALAAGVTLFSGSPLTGVAAGASSWELTTSTLTLESKILIAADGRNSSTCRLLGLAPATLPGRLAQQCHAPLHPDYRETVSLEFLRGGYCGMAPVGAGQMNLCLVSDAAHLAGAKAALHARFGLAGDHSWHSIAPLTRADIPPAPQPRCFLAGDAARVVEPFTGEGIYYALGSGKLAAAAAGQALRGDEEGAARDYRLAHRALYRHRLWVNRLSRLAVTRPALGEALLGLGRFFPGLLRMLTAKVVAGA